MLRYGGFYGPGTSLAPGGEQFDMVRKRKFPVVGDGAGMWSFVHIADAAEATVAAVEHGKRGIYNVVDNDPAAVSEWLPPLAALEAGERIDSPHAFVATITTRLAIDELRSARARRERYVGEWLPEPILTDSRDDPAQHAEIADSLSMAMLILLETLSPEQRAVLLLRWPTTSC